MSEIQDKPVSATTVERTSKQLKLHQVVSVLFIIVGGVWVYSASNAGTSPGVGAWFLGIGLVWYIVTRIRIWWHHK